MSALCYIKLARRVSTGVVQLICNQKVGGSNPSPGTSSTTYRVEIKRFRKYEGDVPRPSANDLRLNGPRR